MPAYLETWEALGALTHLPPGWHYGAGVAPSPFAASVMRTLLMQADMLGFNVFEAFPGAEGEIQLAIHDGERFLAATFEPNITFTILHEENGEQVAFQEGLTFQEVAAYLQDFASQIWNTSELFTYSIFLPLTASPAISPSSTPRTAQASLVSKWAALLLKAGHSASTFPAFIQCP